MDASKKNLSSDFDDFLQGSNHYGPFIEPYQHGKNILGLEGESRGQIWKTHNFGKKIPQKLGGGGGPPALKLK